jgi:hypothetical protein
MVGNTLTAETCNVTQYIDISHCRYQDVRGFVWRKVPDCETNRYVSNKDLNKGICAIKLVTFFVCYSYLLLETYKILNSSSQCLDTAYVTILDSFSQYVKSDR